MKIRIIILSLFLVQFQNSFTQVVDVDTYTGRATTTIPLWTVRSGSLSYPIVAYNNSNGIKADNYSGALGVGWEISAVSSIVRDLRGLPDDYNNTSGTTTRQGWLVNNTYSIVGNFVPSADDNLSDCTDEESDFNFLNSLGGFSGSTLRDTEPDIYNINTGGLSGSFTFDNTGKIAFLTKQDYKVTYTLDATGSIIGFIIVNENGVVYTFGQPARSTIRAVTSNEGAITHFKYQYNLYKNVISYYSQWMLLSIESSNSEKINFEYRPQLPTINSYGDTLLLRPASQTKKVYASNYFSQLNQADPNVEQYSIVTWEGFPRQFKKIYTRSETVEGVTGSIAFPVGNYYTLKKPVLNSIVIYDQSRKIKAFNFEYEALGEEESPQYLLLRSIKEVSGSLGLSYTFDYYGVDFVAKVVSTLSGKFKDDFGFLNKDVSEEPSFKTFVYPGLTGADRFRNMPIPGYGNEHYETTGLQSDALDLNALLTMNLKQVTLPKGGVNRIFYEPNYYHDAPTQNDYYGGGLRVNRVEYHDGVNYANDMVTNYIYEDNGVSTGVLLYRPLRAFTLNASIDLQTGVATYYNALVSQGLNAAEILKRTTVITNGDELNKSSDQGLFIGYRKVSVSQSGAGKTVYEYDIAASFGTQTETGWTATKNKIARDNPNNGTSIISLDPGSVIGYYTYPFAPNPNFDYKRGLLKKMSAYDNANNIVKETVNEYTFLSAPIKVYALKLDQYNALLTYNRPLPVVEGSEPVLATVTQSVPMFIYSRYEINTNVRPRLLKTTTKTFDQGNPLAYLTNVQRYEYAAVGHDQATRLVQTGSDGVEYATNYKYPADYSITGTWAQQDNATKAITKLKDKNIIVPVETWSTKKEGTETPAVVSASLSTFEYDDLTDNLYIKKSYALATRDALSDFSPSSVNNTASASVFQFENTKYNTSVDYLNQDAFGKALSTLSYDKRKSSIHIDATSGVTKAVIANALADQVVFSDFESVSGYDFAYAVNNQIVTGRAGGKGLNLLAGSSNKLTKALVKGDGLSYAFSCWIKASSSGTLTVRVNDGVHTQVTVPIEFTSTSGVWKYFSAKLATSVLNSNVTVEAEPSVAVTIDDVLFYPAAANITTYLYGIGYTKIAETNTQGISRYYEYDALGRLTVERDQDQNIIKSYQYIAPTKSVQNNYMNVNTSEIFGQAYVNVPTVLTISPSYEGAIYKIKIVKLQDHQSNPNLITDFSNAITSATYTLPYTFTQTGEWMINIQITYQGNVITSDYYNHITVLDVPLTVTMCANRPPKIDLCNPTAQLLTDCVFTQTNDLILKVTVTGGSGSYSYNWRSRRNASIDPDQEYSNNSPVFSTSDLAFDLIYECRVTDLVTNSGGRAELRIQTYKSDPNCSLPNQN